PSARELAVDALEVRAHRVAGLARIVGREGLEDRAMIVDRGGLECWCLEVLLHQAPHRAAPAVPEVFDDRLDDAVAGRRRDAHVKLAIERREVLVLLLESL